MKQRWRWLTTALVVTFIVSTSIFAIATIVAQRSHEARLGHALATAQNAQRQANGDQAMIYAVCSAFYLRDVAEAQKWRRLTEVERHFRHPNSNETDAEYHAARRVAFVAAGKIDQQILQSDCLRGMVKAYENGARSAKPPLDTRHSSPTTKLPAPTRDVRPGP